MLWNTPREAVGPADANSAPRLLSEQAQFRREAECWTIGYAGTQFRLKDTKGLAYIAQMLRYPGTQFHALDLARSSATLIDSGGNQPAALPLDLHGSDRAGIHVGNPDDAGNLLDPQVKANYRRRLAELRIEFEEAKAVGRIDRAENAEVEIEALVEQLSQASGLGGRDPRASSAAERARQSVTRAIKSAVSRITNEHFALGQILSRSITTGAYCSYNPDPNLAICWDFDPMNVETAVSPHPEIPNGTAPEQTAAVVSARALPISGPSALNQTAFVGRQREIELLQGLIERAQSGQGSLVMIGGGAGVGKTRLAAEAAGYAAKRGFFCNIGRCHESEEPSPYLPFAEILEGAMERAPSPDVFRQSVGEYAADLAQIAPAVRRIFPEIQPSPPMPPQSRRLLFNSVSEHLKRLADAAPLVIILDDLQWADEPTLALLSHLTHRLGQIPMVIIGTYRDLDLQENPALVRTLEELIRIGIRPLKLQGLSEDDVAQMLRSLSSQEPPARFVRVMFEQTQGNPFFVEELYRHLAEEGKVFGPSGEFQSEFSTEQIGLPDNVRLVLWRRLERLEEKARRVLTVAAAIGHGFPFELLHSLHGHIPVEELLASLEQAERMGLIMSGPDSEEASFTFVHDLVRQTLLASISAARRKLLHKRTAETFERSHAAAA